MVLSNAERQARYRQRLKALAASGVTPEMVLRAAMLTYERDAQDNPDFQRSWAEHLNFCRTRKGREYWSQWVPDDPTDDYAEYGDDAELMGKVAAVARVVKYPPPPSED